MTWVVTVHDGGGSMVEAADPSLAFVVSSDAEAAALCEALNQALRRTRDGYHDRECWATYFEAVTPPTTTPPPGTPPGFVGVDANKIIVDWIKDKG